MAEAAVENMPVKSEAGTSGKPLLGLAFLDNLAQMSMLRQLGLLVGLAASVAIGFAVVLWSQQPDYRPLYGSLSGMDANQVVEALNTANIPFRVEPNSGAVLVKADDLAQARLRLAGAGVTAVYGGNACTYSDPARYFSYRRDGVTGRMATLIWLEENDSV